MAQQKCSDIFRSKCLMQTLPNKWGEVRALRAPDFWERNMTRYDELSALAVKTTEEFYDAKLSCEDFARHLILKLREFLGAPAETVQFIQLDADLRATGETHDSEPRLRRMPDGSWHFGIQIHFRRSTSLAFGKVTLKMSVQKQPDGFKLKYEREFIVDDSGSDSISQLFQFIYDGLKEDYSKPMDAPKPRIGF